MSNMKVCIPCQGSREKLCLTGLLKPGVTNLKATFYNMLISSGDKKSNHKLMHIYIFSETATI